jgi:hypothetical protein
MERKHGIEEQIDSILESAKKVQPVEVPFGFADRAMQRLREQKQEVTSIWPAILKIAAVIILVVVNSYTVNYIINSPSQQPQEVSAPASVNDLVSDYQVSDINDDILTPNTIEHEQP